MMRYISLNLSQEIAWPVTVSASVHAPEAVADDPVAYAGPDSFTFVHVRATDAEGFVGHGFTGRFLAPEVAAFVNRIGSELNARDDDPLGAMMRRLNPRGMTGVVVSAQSALEVAFTDLRGKRADRPVWRMFGGVRNSAPAHVTCGLPSLEAADLIDACVTEICAGAEGVKVLIGASGRSLSEDMARLRLVRQAIGPDVDLIADANCAWDRETAIAAVRAAESLDLAWLEEPVRQNDPSDLAALVATGIVPIGAGQMEQSTDRFNRLLDAGVSVIQPNAVFAGGFEAVLDTAGKAVRSKRTVSPAGGWDAINLHWMCGAMTEGAVELHRAQTRINRLLRPSHSVRNGRMVMSEAPGLGLNPDEAALARCRVL